jgi:hypothetical protein
MIGYCCTLAMLTGSRVDVSINKYKRLRMAFSVLRWGLALRSIAKKRHDVDEVLLFSLVDVRGGHCPAARPQALQWAAVNRSR